MILVFARDVVGENKKSNSLYNSNHVFAEILDESDKKSKPWENKYEFEYETNYQRCVSIEG